MNHQLAKSVLEELANIGVEEYVVSPGARNLPLIECLTQAKATVHYFVDERSSAFFALGRIKSTKRPVAVITTSGTAAGELLPAMMEAYYTSLPIIAVTADRPRRFRGKNPPQSAEQKNLFGVYAPLAFDVEGHERVSLSCFHGTHPLHLNVCFEEPGKEARTEPLHLNIGEFNPKQTLGDQESLHSFLKRARRPLVIVSNLRKEEKQAVELFLSRLKAPLFLEATSQLHSSNALLPYRVFYPKIKEHDAIIRIGGVPTDRIWRDLESYEGIYEVLSISQNPFLGLSFGELIHTDLKPFFEGIEKVKSSWDFDEEFFERERAFSSAREALFDEAENSEPSLVKTILHNIPEDALLFLGNSLPIRNVDMALHALNDPFEVVAMRGLNGIDGQLSCFLGQAMEGRENVAILGDLTLLYDFSGFWALKNIDVPFTLIVINNKGGKIFDRLYPLKELQNTHSHHFEEIAAFWKIPYKRVEKESEFSFSRGIIEVCPDPEKSKVFYENYEFIKKENALLQGSSR